jgi:hygromycin-B 4-O-kinase
VIDLGWLDERHAYCISRLLPGRTLQDLAEHEIEPTLEPTAQVLATIAGVDLEDTISWGWFDAEGVGTSPTWQDYLLDIPDVSPAPDASGLDRAFIDRVFDELRWLAPLCHSPRRLVHGDFGSNNVLTDGHAITGVIDWDMAVYGDPLYDIANVMFWRSWLPCMDHLAAYVERTLPHSIEIDRRLHCYQLRIGLVEVLGLASSQDTDFARWVTSRLASIVAE